MLHSTKFPRDDTFSDLSIVSPMPSLDVSYTAYLTPEVLTPSMLAPLAVPPSLHDWVWTEPIYDEVDEGGIHHNPLYWLFAGHEELPELTLSHYHDPRPPSPLFSLREEERAFNLLYEEMLARPPPLPPRSDSPFLHNFSDYIGQSPSTDSHISLLNAMSDLSLLEQLPLGPAKPPRAKRNGRRRSRRSAHSVLATHRR